MEIDFVAWIGLALRWLHLITGIAWIGSSFYFVWLDNSLKDSELWAVHGGGFYHKKKYLVAPDHMPEDLHWFKWEAYFTWISGFLLLSLVYYYGAGLNLIDHAKMYLDPGEAVLLGLAFIAGGWIFYDSLCKTDIGKNNRLFGCIWFLALTGAAYALNQIFSGRGAYIHVGAMIGTVMVANVFFVIIPNQKKVVAALLAGKKPDPRLGAQAKQRSLHNNYMTLPVLLIMISNHYPMLFGHPYNWLILAGLSAASWFIRQFFNLKHKGDVNYWYPAIGSVLFVLVMLFSSGVFNGTAGAVSGEKVSAAEVRSLIRTHCSACHSDTPTHTGMAEAPLGVMFDTMEQIKKHAPRIKARAVEIKDMPLGNEKNMTEEERRKLGAGLDQLPR
ncbi:MAG: urate hydroxylase PuuD [Proteobacteria bacterium]|nr:urate hydroxylase PuuD [Pseudomonadota bacterium]